jgi:hypothetical protein
MIEVGVVADARQQGHGDGDPVGPVGLPVQPAAEAVLGLQVQIVQIGQHAEHLLAGVLFQPVQARLQQGEVAAKTIDDEAAHARPFAVAQQFQGADDLGKHAALVDVRHQHHRAVHFFGEAHVGDVAIAQVHFRGAARTFHHDRAILPLQPRIGFQHGGHGARLVPVIGDGVEIGQGAAVDNHLRAGVAAGFEQHRVHVGVRFQAAGLGLHRLGPADFAAVHGDGAVERHVLRLERRHGHVAPVQHAAQPRHQRGFAGVGTGALDHQCAVHVSCFSSVGLI